MSLRVLWRMEMRKTTDMRGPCCQIVFSLPKTMVDSTGPHRRQESVVVEAVGSEGT
jgi:hypothetical protein